MHLSTKCFPGLMAALFAILLCLPNDVKATTTEPCDDDAITINVVSLVDVSCFGLATGAVTVLATGGIPLYTYVWSNGTIGPVNLALSAGVYTVTCTDLVGATATLSVTIDEPDELDVLVLSHVNIDCNNATGTVTVGSEGGSGLAIYLWSNGTVGPVATNLSAGVYVVTATDANGCISIETVTVSADLTLPTVNASVNAEISCLNATVTLDGTGSAVGSNLVYLWTTVDGHIVSGASTLNNCVVDEPGTYVLLVTDLLNGCSASEGVTVSANVTLPAVNASVNAEISCLNASVTLDGTGSAIGSNLIYLWTTVDGHIVSGASTLNNCVVDEPGTYVLLVTDLLNGCSASDGVTVSANLQLPTVQINAAVALGCQNSTVVLDASGSTPATGVVYLWTTIDGNIVSGHNTATPTVNAAGTYTLTITIAASGCSATGNVVVIGSPSVTVVVESITDVACFGGANGSATINVTSGTASYTYLWSNGQTGATASNLPAGIHTVTVTDAAGCAAVVLVNIAQPAQLTATATATATSAPNANDGSISLSVTGGTSPYTFLWSNGMTTANITGLPAGSYSVTVTDANGCTIEIEVVVPIGGSGCTLGVTLTAQNTACGQQTGSVTAAAINLIGSATYLWSNGMTSATINGLAAGTYAVTVTDGNGCEATGSAVVGVAADATPPTVIAQHINIFLDSNGIATLTAAMINNGSFDLCGSITISINVDSFDCSDLGPNTVVLSATDQSGNTATATAIVTVVDNIPPVLTCPDNISVTSSGVVNYTLPTFTDNCSSTTGLTPILIAGLPSGAMFPNGTTTVIYALMTPTGIETCNFTVTVTPTVTVVVTVTPPDCPGMSNGSATVTVTGCTGPFSYIWMDETGATVGTTATVNNLSAGVYTVIVASTSSNCSVVNTFVINDPAPIDIDVVVISNECIGATGSISLTVTGGTPPYTYEWFDENGQLIATTESVDSIAAGDYTVEVTDANGCVASSGVLTIDHLNGILELNSAQGEVNIFPNPTSNGIATLEIALPQESDVEVRIHNLQGDLLKNVMDDTFQSNTMQMDLRDLPSGSYLLKVLVDGSPITRKIISMR